MEILVIGSGIPENTKYKHPTKENFKENKNDVVIFLDKQKSKGIDVSWDLENTPLPFRDNEFYRVIAYHVLEHLDNKRSLYRLMDELHRILNSKGILKIKVPHFSSFVAYESPDHVLFFGYDTFGWWTEEWFEPYYVRRKWKIIKSKLNFLIDGPFNKPFLFLNKIVGPIINKFPTFYSRFLCWLLPCDEIYVELIPVK